MDDGRKKRIPTDRQLQFVVEYVKDLNGTQAAIRAGYGEKHADDEGARNLADPVVRGMIDRHLQARFEQAEARLKAKAEQHDITAERVLEELASIAFADIGNCFDAEGRKLPVHEIPEITRRALSSVDVVVRKNHQRDGDADQVEKIRMIDKNKALDLLGRYFGMLVERKEVGRPGEFKKLTDAELEEKTRALIAKAMAPPPKPDAVH